MDLDGKGGGGGWCCHSSVACSLDGGGGAILASGDGKGFPPGSDNDGDSDRN